MFITESHQALARRYGTLLARVFIGILFLLAGVSKVAGFQGTVSYIASTGAPMPELLNILAIIVEIGGGLALILGVYTAEAAASLIVFCLAAVFMFHNPLDWWGQKDAAGAIQQQMFMKDLGIIGGLLYIVGYGAGEGWSLARDRAALKKNALPE